MWAVLFEKCIACGKDEYPHKSKGLCTKCWNIFLSIKNEVNAQIPKKIETVVFTEEYLKRKNHKNDNPIANDVSLINKKWAVNYDKCICCGKVESPHASKGLCRKCYAKYQSRKDNPKIESPLESNVLSLTKEYLYHEYVENGKSLFDIAKECGRTRQGVYKQLVKYAIPVREKREARLIALEKNKIKYSKTDKDGNVREVTHQKAVVDEYFFSYWSAPMAWVLGFIYADGNIDSRSIFHEPKIRLTQKEPEILEKIKKLMGSNQRLIYSKEKKYKNVISGEVYHLEFRNSQLYYDLTQLGLTFAKSLSITFPNVPQEYLWHFIRGCWDGDGSIYIEKRTGSIHAHYVSGSKVFMEKFIMILKAELAIGEIKLYKGKIGNVYYFKLNGANCLKFCHHLYDGVSPDLYLSRKFNVYKNYLEKGKP